MSFRARYSNYSSFSVQSMPPSWICKGPRSVSPCYLSLPSLTPDPQPNTLDMNLANRWRCSMGVCSLPKW